ncbi:quinate permease [Aspergillus lentulus]|uniref:sugar porter family MFS transporter n=1 Tax=Aspergillus lentulus TaxID=293939 RepID=UPI0013954B38|nr:quinate permease [Aspergillus lentulus]GFF31561.1 quinate permease [Aspergillus lentulus]
MRSYTQLPQQDPDDLDLVPPDPTEQTDFRLAGLRLFWLAAVLCCGGALFGYDSGVIGGVLTFESFARDFRYSPAEKTCVSSIAVGIQQAGALVGCFAVWPVTNRWGRRLAMMACSAVFCAGVILEVINSHSLALFYAGRVICGLGIGGSATVIPIYMAEMSPKESRARLGSCYQFTYTIGILVSYWIDYAIKFMPASPAQWQIPIALQLVPGALMGLGTSTLPESVRWLLAKGDHARAHSSLLWIRAASPSSPALSAEFTDMRQGLEQERAATANFHPRELLAGPNARRLLLAFGLFLAQQSTGATALAYFAPQFFSLLVGPSDSDSESTTPLLLTGIFGAIKVLSCLFFLLFLSDRFGRRPLLLSGAAAMSACMLATAAVLKSYPRAPASPGTPAESITPAAIATITLIYLDITAYNLSWGPLPWPCVSELFPTRIREPGVAVGVGAQWMFNFVWSFSTPFILAKIKWATFLLFGGLDLLIVGFVWGCVLETRGKSLEEISALFEGDSRDSESRREAGCEAASNGDGDGDRSKDGSILHVEAGSASS